MGYVSNLLACLRDRSISIDGKLRVYQNTSQFEKDMAASVSCGPGLAERMFVTNSRDAKERTWQLKLSQSPTAAEIVFIFIHFTKMQTVFCVVLVNKPVFLGAVSRPPAVRTFEGDRSRLAVRVIKCVIIMRRTNGTWCQRLDSLPSTNYRRERRCGERMEKVVL
jgi:hypothetical protein